MQAVGVLVVHLVRRGWRPTVFLALLAGFSAGIAMAACAAGRRTSTVLDRFVRFADPPQLIVTFCPPDFVEIDAESLGQCFDYDPAREIEVIAALAEIDSVGRMKFSGMTASSTSGPPRTWLANTTTVESHDLRSYVGERMVLRGRWFSPDAADEVVVNERFVDESGVAVGDEIQLTLWSKDEIGRVPRSGESLHGPTARVTVVGVVRGLFDLGTSGESSISSLDQSEAVGGAALAAATAEAGGFGGVVVRARNGDVEAARAAIERTFADRQFNISPALAAADVEPIREAIDYEARSAWAFGLIAGLAAAVFVGQAVARQTRREWSQLPTLQALGLARGQVQRVALLRGASTGVASAAIAAGTAVVLSPFGPIGQGRRAEVNRGISVDGWVVAIGAMVVLVGVTAATFVPATRVSGTRSVERSRRSRLFGRHGLLPVEAVAGLRMINAGGRDGRAVRVGGAIAGVAFAIGTVVAALGLTSSLDALTGSPPRYGAPWDLSIVSVEGGLGDASAELAEVLSDQDGVEAAAGIVGTDVAIGDEVIWVQTFRPLQGLDAIRPVITDGREPSAIDEIALGSITMRDLGLGFGDTIDVRSTVTGDAPMTMTVVGTTIVNDTYEPSPGRGGVVTDDWIVANSPGSSADPVVIQLDAEADAEATAAEIERTLPVAISQPSPHGAIRNIERISSLPYLVAGLICALALASLAHAITSSIRRSRHEFAVWTSLGFTRGQVRSAAAWHATTLAGIAAIVGIPLGVVLGRLGWGVVADQIGVPGQASTPLIPVVVTTGATILTANLIAAYPAWRAVRIPTATALRSE